MSLKISYSFLSLINFLILTEIVSKAYNEVRLIFKEKNIIFKEEMIKEILIKRIIESSVFFFLVIQSALYAENSELFLAIEKENKNILSFLYKKWSQLSTISYNLHRKIVYKNQQSFQKAKVSLVPFRNFKLAYLYPEERTIIFDGNTLTILKNNIIISKEDIKITNYNHLRTILLSTGLFIYYLRTPSEYIYENTKENIITFRSEGKNYKELLSIDKKTFTPIEMLIEMKTSKIKVTFSDVVNIDDITMPTKITTEIFSTKDISENMIEEINIIEIKFERR